MRIEPAEAFVQIGLLVFLLKIVIITINYLSNRPCYHLLFSFVSSLLLPFGLFIDGKGPKGISSLD